MTLTQKELEFMRILWDTQKPLTKSEIVEIARGREVSWRESSFYEIANNLLDKAVIQEAGFVCDTKRPSRQFEPKISCEDYFAGAMSSGSKSVDLPVLFSALIKGKNIKMETIEKLEEILQEGKAELD